MMTSKSNSGFTPWPEEYKTRYRAAGYWTDLTIPKMLEISSRNYPDQKALICGEREFTYREVNEKVISLSTGFYSKLKLRNGDKVVLHLPNSAEFYFCLFALLRIGVQPLLALPAHRYAELSYFCDFIQAKALITGSQLNVDIELLSEKIVENSTVKPQIVWCGSGKPKYGVKIGELYSANADVNSNSNEEFALFQLSGGTTGTPKLIPRTHYDYLYSVEKSNQVCDFSSRTRYLCVLPAAHNFSLSSPGALGCFMAGGTVILGQDSSPQTVFSLIEKHKVTVTAAVPPLARLWLAYAKERIYDISSLGVLQVGGARFDEETARQVRPIMGCQLQQVFGMAEGLVNYTRLDDPEDVIVTTQGRPMCDGDEIRVEDKSGNLVPTGTPGLLRVRGAYTIRGYFNAPEHNRISFDSEGFYHTGDIVSVTQEGNLQVVGRVKDQINRGGEKIAAPEVENHLLAHRDIHDAAVVGVPDAYLGEQSCAVIVCIEKQLKPIEIKRFLRSKGVADYKVPDRIIFVDVLPKTAVGKVDKNKLIGDFNSHENRIPY